MFEKIASFLGHSLLCAVLLSLICIAVIGTYRICLLILFS
jgi:hypothetical protein